MDVNKTVKINKLAKELLKHGLVDSIEEGMTSAEKHIREEEGGEQMETQKSEQTSVASSQSINQGDNQTNVAILERKLNYLAKSFAEQFNAEIGEVKKQIESINKELREIRDKIRQASVQRQSQPSQPQQQLHQEPPKQQLKKDEAEIKPRTGDLTPDDVDLENYFYFGNKR